MHLAFSSMNTPSDPHPAKLAKALEERGFESLWYGEHSHIPCSRATPYPAGGELPDPYRRMMDPLPVPDDGRERNEQIALGNGYCALDGARSLFAGKNNCHPGSIVRWACAHRHGRWLEPRKNSKTLVPTLSISATRCYVRRWLRRGRCGRKKRHPFTESTFASMPCGAIRNPCKRVGPRFSWVPWGRWGESTLRLGRMAGIPVDVALGDISESIASFREEVRAAGRDPDSVEINIQIMDTENLDRLKYYRDLGVQRATIGVSIDVWDQPEAVMPMIDTYAKVIPDLG